MERQLNGSVSIIDDNEEFLQTSVDHNVGKELSICLDNDSFLLLEQNLKGSPLREVVHELNKLRSSPERIKLNESNEINNSKFALFSNNSFQQISDPLRELIEPRPSSFTMNECLNLLFGQQ